MKTKEKQGYSYILSLAALLLALTCAILCGVLPTVAAKNASENNFLEENYNITEEYSALLGEESNLYSSLDAGAQKEVSKSVINLINAYRKELLDLQSHPDADKRLLSKEINLSYAKGCAAGTLGWIYHYNYPRLESNEAQSATKSAYESYLAEIDGASDASVLSARAELIAAEMNREVYSQLIRELADEYADVFIPLDELFAEAIKTQPEPKFYSADGVHPNANGAEFIGKIYAEAIEPLLK